MEIYVSFSSSSLHLFGYSVVHASKEVASEEMMKSYAFVIYEFRFGNKGGKNLNLFYFIIASCIFNVVRKGISRIDRVFMVNLI